MRKVLGSFNKMRQYLEQEMLAESLRGRIRYHCTAYPGMDGCHLFELRVDNQCFKRFSWETVQSYFIKEGYKARPADPMEYWQGFFKLLAQVPVTSRTEYTDEEFCAALKVYRHQTIDESIKDINPLVCMFGILDRRLGK